MEENMDDVSCRPKESMAAPHAGPDIMLLTAPMQLLYKDRRHGNCASKSFDTSMEKWQTGCSCQQSPKHPKFLWQRHDVLASFQPLNRHLAKRLRIPSHSSLGRAQSPPDCAKCANSKLSQPRGSPHGTVLMKWTRPSSHPSPTRGKIRYC